MIFHFIDLKSIQYYQVMKILSTILIILVLFIHSASSINCSATHFDFIGKYSIGKQDQLNRTFIKLQQKITTIANATYVFSETTSYTIFNAKPIFYYRDSQQKAKILGNDTIIVYDGTLEVDLTFQWTKKSLLTRNGTGSAFGLSDKITFAKQAIIQDSDFFSFELLDYEDVTWTNGQAFRLRRVEPADASDEDKAALTRLLNDIMSVRTIKNLLEQEIDKIYSYNLRASLHDQHMPIDNHFDYVWNPGYNRTNVTVPFSRRAVTIDIQTEGVQLTFQVQAINASDWRCGNRTVPILPLNPRVYGSTQQYVSFDFYENVVRHAISKNLLNTDLNRVNWESTMFQFFAGDLYQVLEKVQDRYFASEEVTGNCKATYTGLKIWKSGFDTFNLSIHFDCELNIKRQKVLDFAVGLQAEILGVPRATSMDFRFRRHEEFVSFYPYADYKLRNEELGKLMVKHSLNRVYQSHLFGSGWPMSPPRDYPHIMTEQNYTIVYDSTHVDPHLIDLLEE